MIKKTITYPNAHGRLVTEDFHFNLTQFEAVELQVSRKGGFTETIEYLSKSGDKKEQLAVIKEVILASYGEVTGVDRHFVKKPEFADAFSHTEAFSILFFELFGDANKAAEFFNELMPAGSDATPQRPATQDHQQKAQSTFQRVDIPLESQSGVEIIRSEHDHQPRMSPASFQAMAPEDGAKFIREGGIIDPSL